MEKSKSKWPSRTQGINQDKKKNRPRHQEKAFTGKNSRTHKNSCGQKGMDGLEREGQKEGEECVKRWGTLKKKKACKPDQYVTLRQ